LQKTPSRYLRSLAPLLTAEEMERSSAAVAEFVRVGGDGERLNMLLEKRAETARNARTYPNAHWLEGLWDQLAYLYERRPLLGGSNIFSTLLGCSPSPRPLLRAAALLHSATLFYLSLKARAIAPESLDTKGKIPLCMFQYDRLFACSRVPSDPQDHFLSSASSRHVSLFSRGHVASLQVIEDDGSPTPLNQIHARLVAFVEASREKRQGWASLTALPRSEWARLRGEIMSSRPEYAETIRAIESSLLTMCLSDEEPASEREQVGVMHAGGEGRDLWYDKSFNLIVCANGRAGVHLEHGHYDAPVSIRLLAFCSRLTRQIESQPDPPSTRAEGGWRMLPMDFSPHPHLQAAVTGGVQKAMAYHASVVASNQLECFRYLSYGRKRMVEHKAGADATLQLALQLAQMRDQGGVVATYETASTRRFFHGRTETIRSCSSQSTAWARAMDDPSMSPTQRGQLFRDAVTAHLSYLLAASNGQGCDRHLLALYALAKQSGLTGEKTPPIFADLAFSKSCTYGLSTSNISTPGAGSGGGDFAGFGAPIVESYGVCYSIEEDRILALVAANRNCPTRCAQRFGKALAKALDDIMLLLDATHTTTAVQPSSRL
ncbi:MAG: hypothetical protein SGPRY_010164, partial [Prymnesium sp.]